MQAVPTIPVGSRASRAKHQGGRAMSPTYAGLMTLLVVLLVVWLVLAILGFVIKGLFWLAIIGLVLFVATAIWGWLRRSSLSS
jgi:Na+-driven multidrug efflux pump